MWEQIKTAYASGIGLREIARNMGIPEGTELARANAKDGRERFKTQRHSQRAWILPLRSVRFKRWQ
jgi:hypothetical protein